MTLCNLMLECFMPECFFLLESFLYLNMLDTVHFVYSLTCGTFHVYFSSGCTVN